MDLEVEDGSAGEGLAMGGLGGAKARGTDWSWAVTLLEFAPIVAGGRGPGPQRLLPSTGTSRSLEGVLRSVCEGVVMFALRVCGEEAGSVVIDFWRSRACQSAWVLGPYR